MAKVIYLIRHGQASFGEANYDQLSTLGHEQSQRLDHALSQKPETIDAVFSGTLTRHLQTLEQARPESEAPIRLADWNEFDHENIFKVRMNQNNVKREQVRNFSKAERLQFFRQAIADWVTAPTENSGYIESWPEFQQRITRAWQTSLEQTDRAALVFTSGGPIATIAGIFWQLNPVQVLLINQALVNAGITKIIAHAQGVQVTTLNEHCHLEEPGKRLITYT